MKYTVYMYSHVVTILQAPDIEVWYYDTVKLIKRGWSSAERSNFTMAGFHVVGWGGKPPPNRGGNRGERERERELSRYGLLLHVALLEWSYDKSTHCFWYMYMLFLVFYIWVWSNQHNKLHGVAYQCTLPGSSSLIAIYRHQQQTILGVRLACQSILGIGTGQLLITEFYQSTVQSCDIFRPRNSL